MVELVISMCLTEGAKKVQFPTEIPLWDCE